MALMPRCHARVSRSQGLALPGPPPKSPPCPHMSWLCWRNHRCIMRMTQEASMSISLQDQSIRMIRLLMIVRLPLVNRRARAGPLDHVRRALHVRYTECICVVFKVCVYVPVLSPLSLPHPFPHRKQPGSRCIGRSTGTGHDLPRLLFLSQSSISVLLTETLCTDRQPWCRD